jgi:hypothetical protein
MRTTRLIIAVLSTAAFVGVVMPGPVTAAEVDLAARLDGSSSYSAATGRSEYESDSDGRDVEVTVAHISRLAGKRVTVVVGGHRVGTMLVSSTGRAHREWDTEHGQYVPVTSAGDTVKVRTSGGTLVASGRYHVERDD